VVDGQMMKEMEEKRAAEIAKEYEDKSNTDEFDQMKEDFAKEQYGAGARVDGNQILDEKGEVVREFDSDEEFAQAMAAAQATKEAAEAMEKIPGIINKGAAAFESKVAGAGKSFERLFVGKEGSKMTAGDVSNLKSIGEEGLKDFWNKSEADGGLSKEEKEVYGNDFNKFLEDYNERLNAASKSLENSQTKLSEFNAEIKINGKMSAEAAKGWTKSMESLNLGGASSEELKKLDDELDGVLNGLTDEEAAIAMAEINSIDKTDTNAWNNLV
jgi:hypothetical protein